MRGTKREWTSLPDDILRIISRLLYLQSPDDFRRFSAVCRTFRSSSSSVTNPPRTLTPNLVFRLEGNDHILRKYCVYAIQPLHQISNNHEATQTSLVIVSEDSNTGELQFKHPRVWLFHSPKDSSIKLPKYLNLLDYRVKKITTSYYSIIPDYRDVFPPVSNYYYILAVSEALDSDRFAIMGIGRLKRDRLFVWRNGDENWSWIYAPDYLNEIGSFRYFTDIAYHNKNFYALIDSGQTVVVDPKSLSLTKIANCPQNSDEIYLVKSIGDLFLIVRSSDGYNVSKLDEKNRKWVPVNVMEELEDRVFIVGGHFSFSYSTIEFSESKIGNCIYIFDWGEHIFDLKDNNYKRLSNSPSHSKIFWPPPAWLKQH